MLDATLALDDQAKRVGGFVHRMHGLRNLIVRLGAIGISPLLPSVFCNFSYPLHHGSVMIGGNGEATMPRTTIIDDGTIVGSRVGAHGGETPWKIFLALVDERDEFLLWCRVALLKARADEQTQLGARAKQRMIPAETFIAHLGVALVGFDDGAVDVERETGTAGHRVQEIVHHGPQSPLTVGAAVASEPIADSITARIAVVFGERAVRVIVLEETNILQADSAIDHHLDECKHVVARRQTAIGTGRGKCAIDPNRKFDRVAKPIDED